MTKYRQLLAAAASLALLPSCPLLTLLDELEATDAGVATADEDAGPDGPRPSDVEGTISVVVSDDEGTALCEPTVTTPELPGFTGVVTLLGDDDETAFTISFGPYGDEADAPTEPPIAMLQIIGHMAGPPEVLPTGNDTLSVARASLTELSNIGGCNGGTLIGALPQTSAFDVTFSELMGEQTADDVSPCPNAEVSGPCDITEGSVRAQGSTTFTVEGGRVEVTFDFVSDALWVVGAQ